MSKWIKDRFHYPSADTVREIVLKHRRTKQPPPKRKQVELQTAIWGRTIQSYLTHPIRKRSFLRVLRRRAKRFEAANTPLPIQLQSNTVYDIGSRCLNGSTIIATLDITKNAALASFLKRNTGVTVDPQKVSAVFYSSQQFPARLQGTQSKLLLRQRNHILVTTHDWDSGHYSQGVITHRGYDVLATGSVTKPKEPFRELRARKPGLALDRMIEPISSRFLGFYDKILAWTGDQWKFLRIKEMGDRITHWKGKDLDAEYVPITLHSLRRSTRSFAALPEPVFTAKVLEEDAQALPFVEYRRRDGSKGTGIVADISVTRFHTRAIGKSNTPASDGSQEISSNSEGGDCWGVGGFRSPYEECACIYDSGRGKKQDCIACCHRIYSTALQSILNAYYLCLLITLGGLICHAIFGILSLGNYDKYLGCLGHKFWYWGTSGCGFYPWSK